MTDDVVGKVAATIDCQQKAVRAVRFNADGNYCLTCGSDKSIKLWNPHRGTLIKTYSGHGYEVLDANSSCDNAKICSCGIDKSVLQWDVASGKVITKYRGHAGQVNCVKYNEDGSLIFSGSIDGTIRVWDCRSRKFDPIQVMDEARDSVTSLYITDHEIISGSADSRIRRYDIRCGQMYADTLPSSVCSVYISRDGQCMLAGTMDSKLRLIDKDTGELLNEYSGHKNNDYKVDSLISANDKQVLSGSEDGQVFIWDLIEGTVLSRLKHIEDKVVHSLSYHPTKPCLLTACQNIIAFLLVSRRPPEKGLLIKTKMLWK